VAECLKYSETEVFTGGYWLDSKKIYRKTYKVTFSQLDVSTQLPPVVNMQTTIKYWGTAIMKDYIMPLPWTDTILNTNWFGYINLSSHTKRPYLYIYTSSNNSSPFDVIINVEYTKTTD
jgi:hypothetical protein